ncbi:MAG TPA: LacI family DNA-binding transcriptional regulator [Mesorhizobium sp.]|nr:LacI family DNA-binding transcriptional regulator [Mesorhizobium sp.]
MRSTLSDVAREAGVSPATVDRVLNNRSGVRSRTREIVIETAQRLGYIADGPSSRAAAKRAKLRLDFVLPMGTNSFIRTLRREIERQGAARPDLDVRIQAIEGFNPDGLSRTLLALEGQTQGVGLIALDHPTVREAIRALTEAGVKVVTLASDIHHVPRIAYVGVDNRQAGRLAGYVLGRFLGREKDAQVALFAGSLSYRGHEEREMGFRHILREEFPNLRIVELREMMDDREKAFAEARALLSRHPGISGIYNIGAGNAGIARALEESGKAGAVVLIGHEVTDDTKPLLLNGVLHAVIDQNPRVEAREALNILSHALRGQAYAPHPPRLQIVFKENIPEF